ncbi:putative holin-like toxin [Bacillus carboniphilus]
MPMMTVFESLTLMISFASLIVVVLSFSNKK